LIKAIYLKRLCKRENVHIRNNSPVEIKKM
jgi:hypothetical protein